MKKSAKLSIISSYIILACMYSDIVTMIRKYDKHKLQKKPMTRKEKPHNNHKTPGRQTKQCNQLSIPYQDDCKTIMDMGHPDSSFDSMFSSD